VTLTGYVADYLARNESTLVDVDTARRYARYFAEAPETKGKTMRALTPQDGQKYRERRRQEGAPGARRRRRPAAVGTTNKELSFARAVYCDWIGACEDRGVPAKPNPFRQRRRDHSDRNKLFQPEPAARTRYLSYREEDRLREAIGAEHWPKVLVAIHAGLDRGAQFGLPWSDVDLTTRTHPERRKGRRSGPVPVITPINDDLLTVLRALPSRGRSAWLFPNDPNDDTAGPLDGADFDRLVWQPALVRAGLTQVIETRETKQVRAQFWCGPQPVAGVRTVEKVHRQIVRSFRWKDLRHTFATRLRMTGADTGTIRDLLGHTSDRMTQRYAHAATSHLHTAVQRLTRTPESPNEVAPGVAPSVARASGEPARDRVARRLSG
jgi:integrase